MRDGMLNFDSSQQFLINFDVVRLDDGNSINRAFLQKVYFGGEIDTDLKDDILNRKVERNLYRSDFGSNLNFTLLRATARYGISFNYGIGNYVSSKFSDDLFELTFYGNSRFGNKPAKIGESYFRSISFQKFGIGAVDQKTGSYFNINIYDGLNYRSYVTENASLQNDFQEFQGSAYINSIMLTTDNYTSQVSSNYSGLFSQALGLGIDVSYNYRFSKGLLIFGIEDFGFMNWKDLDTRDSSGTFEFSGFEYDLSDGNFENGFFPSLPDSIFPNLDQESKTFLLPGRLSATFITNSEGRFFTILGVQYRYGLGLYPSADASVNLRFGKKSSVWGSLNLGGFGIIDAGIGAQIYILEKSYLTIGSRHLSGIINPNGRAGSIYLQYTIRL